MNERQFRALARPYIVRNGRRFRLKNFDPKGPGRRRDRTHNAKKFLKKSVEALCGLQEKLYAQDRWGVLLIFQAMDAAGKDSAIKHVMSGDRSEGLPGLLVQGAVDRGARSRLPVAHVARRCPSAGGSASSTARTTRRRWSSACTRSSSTRQKLPARAHHEAHLEGALRGHQRVRALPRAQRLRDPQVLPERVAAPSSSRRFLERLERPEKNWKFSIGDLAERERWRAYMTAYEDMIRAHRDAARAVGRRFPPTTRSSRGRSSPRRSSTR